MLVLTLLTSSALWLGLESCPSRDGAFQQNTVREQIAHCRDSLE